MSTTDVEKDITETFYVIMQKSLANCPSSPPRERYLVTRAPRSTNFIVDVKVYSEATLKLDPTINQSLKVAEHAKSIARFQQLMNEIPTQYTGMEDLYGRDTSVVQATDPMRMWKIHLPEDEAPEVAHPTEEQKAKFDEVVGIIEGWGHSGGPLPR